MLTLKRLISSLMVLSLAGALNLSAQEKVDLEMIGKIRYEGFRNSKIMEIASGLMDQVGPRLTGSPNAKKANEWTRARLEEFGLVNSHLEPWGPFGRGWANEYINVRMVSPDIAPLIAYAKAWTPGTEGAVRGKVMRVNIRGPQDLARYRGKLAGKILLVGDDPEVKPSVEPLAERLNEKSLGDIEHYQIPSERVNPLAREFAQRARFQRQLNKFYDDEKVLAVIDHSRGAIGGGTVFVQSGGSYKVGQTVGTPQITLATEHWTRIVRILTAKKEVELELNMKNNFYDGPDSMNQNDTIAEIPGTDKKDEVVMLGAHLDSWHSGTGATDNGAGTVVMMEAVRILKALDIKPRRTIRIGLWTGEEQGLLGSEWYVQHHFGSRPESKDPERKGDPSVRRRENGPMTTTPEQKKVSVYFNIDNGTGKIRGIFLQENASAQPIFEAWMKPFHDLGMDTLSMRNTGGTDHLSFDAAGIPGFQFIQDPIEYDTRTHHSNMDVYDRLQPEDLKQMAVIVASFVYMAAQRDQMFPRKPIEKELPPPPPPAEDEENANPPSPVTNPAAADRPQQPKPAEQRPQEQKPQAQPSPTPRPK
ncbi:MAG TPA: M20/M25/M40 family metallo-hydrolase [Candidatus Sulfotelmatobacter sp.]|nr:M20/M25/M40 family metallo-hydrolase [Candidatus Sulfotelmatobacter sp.]